MQTQILSLLPQCERAAPELGPLPSSLPHTRTAALLPAACTAAVSQ